MAITARTRRVGSTTRTALNESARSVLGFASIDRDESASCLPRPPVEPIQEVVVVPVSAVLAQLPRETLALDCVGEKTFIQATPMMEIMASEGPIHFRVSEIQQVCPHLFRPGYRVDPVALIQIPEDQVFLGMPRWQSYSEPSLHLSPTSFDSISSTAISSS